MLEDWHNATRNDYNDASFFFGSELLLEKETLRVDNGRPTLFQCNSQGITLWYDMMWELSLCVFTVAMNVVFW